MLLGTAGAISVIIAVAAHQVLGNILVGIQIAVTEPVRIGDSVIFDGQWGRVERIHYTHLEVRTWDHRRLVVPFSYLMREPFENWSGTDAHLVRPIYLYVDFHTDIEWLRERFVDACRSSGAWDSQTEPQVLVTGFRDNAVEVRCTCAAADPTRAWELVCLLRERMLHVLQDARAPFPRQREQHVESPGGFTRPRAAAPS